MEADRPIYVFHHVPKAGGKSCLDAFAAWFELVKDYRRGRPQETPDDYPERVDTAGLRPDQLLCGHWEYPGFFLWQRYPELLERADVRLITFVREPLDLAKSLYYFSQNKHKADLDKTLWEKVWLVRNHAGRLLGADLEKPGLGLDRYWFIGLTERLQESFDVLARLMGREPVDVGRINATERDEQALTEEQVEKFRRLNALDYAIYAEAQRRFDEVSRRVLARG